MPKDPNKGLAEKAQKDLYELQCRGGHLHGQMVWIHRGSHTFTYPILTQVPFWREDEKGEWYCTSYLEGVYRYDTDEKGPFLQWVGAR